MFGKLDRYAVLAIGGAVGLLFGIGGMKTYDHFKNKDSKKETKKDEPKKEETKAS